MVTDVSNARGALLGADEMLASARSIASAQYDSGAIPSVPGGAIEPWNHVEAAIALDLVGLHEHAVSAYAFLASRQRPDGSWFASYGPDGTASADHVDTNATAYMATGVLAHLLSGGTERAVAELWPVVERALDCVLRRERRPGIVPWSVQPDGSDAPFSLLAGSSSLCSSLRHAAALGELLECSRPRFAEASTRVADSILRRAEAFADRSEFAMDWYYPVLAGALDGQAATRHMALGATTFVTEDGVRCRADERWVTAAESAEAAIAYARIGDESTARALLASTSDKRMVSGAYLTGLVYPERSQFPPGEVSTYSTAAVMLANDALSGGVVAELFESTVEQS